MSTFLYPPLDLNQNSIRLLHVHKGAWPNDVYCSLVEATTDPGEAVPYKALSYTWGAVEGERALQLPLPRIFVNNRLFPATDNLRIALSHIQDPSHDTMLWADAICINQQDDREKGHQVKQMAQIYKNAEEVLIWLGPANEEIRDLFDFVNSVDQQAIGILAPRRSEQWATHCYNFMRDQYNNAKTSQNITALQQLLNRRWFKRIWVLQEVAMARSAQILCGSSSCPARTFSLMPSFFEIIMTQHSQAVLDLMPRIRSNTWWASDRTLHNLLVKFQHSRATDERDMIYALLSMSQDACDSKLFYPSYEIRTSEVVKNTASILIFGQMHVLTAALPSVPVSSLVLPLARLVTLLLEAVFRGHYTMEERSHENRILEETLREYCTLEEVSREHNVSKGAPYEYLELAETISKYRTSVGASGDDRKLEEIFRKDRELDKEFGKKSLWEIHPVEYRQLERPSVEFGNLESTLYRYRKSRLGEMDKSLSSFTEQLRCIDLSTVQIQHCLSTFLSIALISPKYLMAWFRIRTPKLLTAKIRAECGELQTRMNCEPESILTLIFEQQNVQEEYRLMEFPIFDRFDDLGHFHFPEDFDLRDRRHGFDSFERFTALLNRMNQTSPTEDESLA